MKIRLACKKIGLYLKIRLRFGDFQEIFRNQDFSENRRNSAFFNFFEVCCFPKTFLYTVLLISIKKLGLYLKIRPRFGNFQKIFRNQAFSESRRNSAVSNFFQVCFFPKTFLYKVLLISIIKIRCYMQKKIEFFFPGLFGP